MPKDKKSCSPVNKEKEIQEKNTLAQYKRLGLKPDGVAYLMCEHKARDIDVTQFLSEEGEGRKQLHALAESIREETGRTCFGKCNSLYEAEACATCFSAKEETWWLCAQIKCINTMIAEKAPTSGAAEYEQKKPHSA